jgi:anti-sigma regulatory factor (Ser/Thr protein kinase)
MLIDQAFGENDLHMVRNAVAAHADHLGLAAERVGDLVLIVSELGSNAVRHGGGAGRLRLWATDAEVVCEVRDDGPGLRQAPPEDRPDPSASNGRGLWLVRRYADDFEATTPETGGTVATVTIRLTPRSTAPTG